MVGEGFTYPAWADSKLLLVGNISNSLAIIEKRTFWATSLAEDAEGHNLKTLGLT